MAAITSLTFFLISLFISPTISNYPLADQVKSWCSQTPNPQPCVYYLTHNPKYDAHIKQKSDFFKLSTQLALDRSTHAQNNLYSLGTKCRNSREKAAWSDCIELYAQTIHRINKTLDHSCTIDEAQTWLSTALTNIETCKSGFLDLGVTDYIMPLMLNNNLSMLLSNTLALNKRQHGNTSYNKGGFPTWVRPGDRKLLQSTPTANIVVAQDGSGNHKTLNEAIEEAGKRSGSGRYVIHVKGGTYRENVDIGIRLKNIMLLGDGIGKTIITGSRSVQGGSTTFNSATVAVVGDAFIARGITFQNTAGAKNGQAVALRSGSDLSVFYQCRFEGYQDTLYVHSQRQFYKECDVHGTVDFIFGNAAVVLQNCNIYPKNSPSKINTITAQGRADPNQNTGISLHYCRVTPDSDLKPVLSSVRTYLGRPWREYSRVVVMKTTLDSLIDPEGWMPWSGDFALNTLYYGEYANTGSGSSTSNRVKWKGYKVITSTSEASQFAPRNLIAADSWMPSTNVPYTSGL